MYESTMWCGPNDGGVKRGDRADTGDEEARPTADVARDGYGIDVEDDRIENDADLASSEGTAEEGYDKFDTSEDQTGLGGDLEDLNILDASDPSLGLTNIAATPPEDWAANTGPTRPNEEIDHQTRSK